MTILGRINRQYFAVMSGYRVYRLMLSSFRSGIDPRQMLIDALGHSLAAETDNEYAAYNEAIDDVIDEVSMDELALRGRSTRH